MVGRFDVVKQGDLGRSARCSCAGLFGANRYEEPAAQESEPS